MEYKIGREVAHIRERIISMATAVEEAVAGALKSFLECDVELAQRVIGSDSRINNYEMEIDKAVFECLALKAPVAGDLRLLFAMQKMNKDLERIGDHAVNIAQAGINCSGLHSATGAVDEISIMSELTRKMLNDSINSFINADLKLALETMEHDDRVDELNRAMTRGVIGIVKNDVSAIEGALELLRVSKNLERIADLSTNIAEDVIFYAQAKDVKHHHGDSASPVP